MDEFELEITPLRPRTAASPAPPGAGDAPRPSDPLARLHPHRRLRAVAAVLAVLLTGAVIIAASPGPRDTLGVLLHGTPTPTVPLPFGADIVYFEHLVPWSPTLPTLDGNPISLDQKSNTSGYFRMSRGRHSLVYVAAPFAPLRCVLTVPAAKGDTCPLGAQVDLNLPGTVKLGRVIDLRGIPTALPADQLATLEAAVRSVVDLPQQPVEVRQGERYLTDAGIQVATQPLSATLIYQLARDSTGCDVVERCNGNCAYLCVPAQGGSDANWNLLAHIQSGWRYATPSGSPVASLSSLFPAEQLDPILVHLSVSWMDGWQVTGLIDPVGSAQQLTGRNPTCDVAGFLNLLLPQPADNNETYDLSGFERSAANPADGCLLTVQLLLFENQRQTTVATFPLLYRFGVLLTLDGVGRAQLLALPQADAYEQALAQQIARASPPVPTGPA